MPADYTNLWKLLLEKRMNKSQLKESAHISTNAVAKLGKNERVSLETLEKICVALDCSINDIVTFTPSEDKHVTDGFSKEKAGTFSLNKAEPIHRWYPYVEGYSSCLVAAELDRLLSDGNKITAVYDPFSGTGTTNLVASTKGIESFFSETNPFMRKVIETKTNSVRAFNARYSVNALKHYITLVKEARVRYFNEWDGFEKFFEQPQLSQLLTIKEIINNETDMDINNLLMLGLSAIVVKASKMVRRGDLRYATEKEYHPENVFELYIEKLSEIIQDIENNGTIIKCGVNKVSDDSQDNNYKDYFDCVITSPPYLNGTNYIRNTKLELKLNDIIASENDLPELHSKGITAGINNVSKRNGTKPPLPETEPYLTRLTSAKYDERIPKMVTGYFYDMDKVFAKLNQSMRNGGIFIMDIGDSQFGGVHIPTHDILIRICKKYGFSLYSEEILRERKSKNNMTLSQRLLRFRLEK